jgi:hypothetical protein
MFVRAIHRHLMRMAPGLQHVAEEARKANAQWKTHRDGGDNAAAITARGWDGLRMISGISDVLRKV